MSLDIIYGFILILKGQGSSNNWREWQSWRDIRIQEFHSCCFAGISLLFFVSLECYPVILKILRNTLPANITITNFSSLDLVVNKESVISVNKVPSLSALQCPLYDCKTLRKEGCLVPELRFPSSSRSIHFCDFSLWPHDPKPFGCGEW